MVGVPIILMSAKTVQVTFPLLFIAACAGALGRGGYDRSKLPLAPATIALFAFLAYAGLSALWAPDPQTTLLIVAMAAIVAVGALLLGQLMQTERLDDALHMIEGLWVGLAFGLLYAIAEIASGQAIKMWAYNLLALGPNDLEPARYFAWANGRLVGIHTDDITRNVFSIPLLIWPAIMGAAVVHKPAVKRLVYGALVVLGTVAVLIGTSATAKVALVAGVISFALACYSTRLAQITLSLLWSGACLAVVPIVIAARALGLQNAEWLHLSARIRITVWNDVAHLVAKAPLLGVGADMTNTIQPPMNEIPNAAAAVLIGSGIAHPHNVYLQVWYELGFVGAALLTCFGLLVLHQIRGMGAARPYGYALFTTAAAAISFSYNLWQIWFMCLFSFAFALFQIGRNVVDNQRPNSQLRRGQIGAAI
jgi:O-antigen ligase